MECTFFDLTLTSCLPEIENKILFPKAKEYEKLQEKVGETKVETSTTS